MRLHALLAYYCLVAGLFTYSASANKPTGPQKPDVSGHSTPTLDELVQIARDRGATAVDKLNRLGFESLSKEDLENLPDEAIKKLPAIELLTRGFPEIQSLEQRRQTATMLVESMLLELKYYLEVPTGEFSNTLKDAVKEFQKSMEAKATGDLLMGEMMELQKRCALVHPPEVILPVDMKVVVFDDFAIIEGTWTFQDGTKSATPLQTSRIQLSRRTKHGVEACAQIWSLQDGEASLSVDINEWEILRWDADEIRAEMTMPSLADVSCTMAVDRNTKKVRMFRLPKSGHEGEWPTQILELRKGWNVSWDFWRGHKDKSLEIMAPAYREAMYRMRNLMKEPAGDPNQAQEPSFNPDKQP